jgi:hypothetical protein
MSGAPAYWPCYCEENVWHACGTPDVDARETVAMVISNAARTVAFGGQRAAPPGELLIWDYHVVVFRRVESVWQVFDPDCRLGPDPCAERWLAASFPALEASQAAYRPLFRWVPAELYRRELRSDRSHMRTGDGWQSSPPPWPPIGEGTNLMRFVDMSDAFLGEVLDLESLRTRLGLG